MNPFNKQTIPVAVNSNSKLDLSCDHITTQNFLMGKPVYYRHMIRGERTINKITSLVRPEPMPVPVFGRCRNNIRSFFVPYRLVFPQYDNFHGDIIGSNYSNSSLVNRPPYFSNADVVTLFDQFTINNQALLVDTPLGDVADIVLVSSGIGKSKTFTYTGRCMYNILLSLGYRINWSDDDTTIYNALALLSWSKVYLDWYTNSAYLDSIDVLNLRQLLSYNDPSVPLSLTVSDIVSLLALVYYVVYDSDYFVSAYDNPVAPNNGQFTPISWSDPTSPLGSTITTNTMGSPEMRQMNTTSVSLGTEYLHSALKALNNYQKRHALSGAREIDRALSQYGFVPDNMKNQRSIYLGGKSMDVDIKAVFSTADTGSLLNQPSNLGDFGGIGIGTFENSIEYTAEEDGILIVISSIVPSVGYVQGVDRNNLILDKTEFFNPEFDGLGVQAIKSSELYVSVNGNFDYQGSLNNQVFGYTGRYAEKKVPRDWFDGDNAYPSISAGGSAWTLFRLFDDSTFNGNPNNVVHSLDFTRGVDWESYNRIFNYWDTKNPRDMFNCFYHFDVISYAPCKPLMETYDFEEHTKEITLDSGGSKLN